MTEKEAVKCFIEEIGEYLVVKPWVLDKNAVLFEQFGVDIRKCKAGKGVKAFATDMLEKKLETITEKSYDDEVRKNPEDALEVTRGCTLTFNYEDFGKSKGMPLVR